MPPKITAEMDDSQIHVAEKQYNGKKFRNKQDKRFKNKQNNEKPIKPVFKKVRYNDHRLPTHSMTPEELYAFYGLEDETGYDDTDD